MIETATKFGLLVLERWPGVLGSATLLITSMGIGFAYLDQTYTRHSDLQPLVVAIDDLQRTLAYNRLADRRDRLQADIYRIERWAQQGTATDRDLAHKDTLRIALANVHEQLAKSSQFTPAEDR